MNTSIGRKNEVVVYDYIRLFAIVAVVFGHSAFIHLGIVVDTSTASPAYFTSRFFHLWRFMTGYVYHFHMAVFFILSGAVYGIYWKNKPEMDNFFHFMVKKVQRLLIPFWLFGTLYMVPIKYLCGYYGKNTFWNAELWMLEGKNTGHLWFLLTLFCIFLLISLIRFFNEQFFRGYFLSFLILGLLIYNAPPLSVKIGNLVLFHQSYLNIFSGFLCFLVSD